MKINLSKAVAPETFNSLNVDPVVSVNLDTGKVTFFVQGRPPHEASQSASVNPKDLAPLVAAIEAMLSAIYKVSAQRDPAEVPQ